MLSERKQAGSPPSPTHGSRPVRPASLEDGTNSRASNGNGTVEIRSILSAHMTLLQSRLESFIQERDSQWQDILASIQGQTPGMRSGRDTKEQQSYDVSKFRGIPSLGARSDEMTLDGSSHNAGWLKKDSGETPVARSERSTRRQKMISARDTHSPMREAPPLRDSPRSALQRISGRHPSSDTGAASKVSSAVSPVPSQVASIHNSDFQLESGPAGIFPSRRSGQDSVIRNASSGDQEEHSYCDISKTQSAFDGEGGGPLYAGNAEGNALQEEAGDFSEFMLHPIWKHEQKSFADVIAARWGNGKHALKNTTMSALNLSLLSSDGKDDESGTQQGRSRCVVSPLARKYLVWNFLFVLVLSYELVTFPLQVFTLPEGGLMDKLAWATASFWSGDLVLSFFLGYFSREGRLVLNHPRIVRHYARSWLVPDILIVSLDWMMLTDVTGGGFDGAGVARIGKVLRYTRVLRALRLLRLRKLIEAMQALDDFINSQAFAICKQIVLNVIAIIVIAHFVACLWYLIGSTEVEGWPSWVGFYGFDPVAWEYAYWSSLHWSLTQFTPGSMNVQPQNSLERFYAVVVLILGLIIFSSIVGNITAATRDLKNMNAWYGKQIWLLRKYFRQRGIRMELQRRVRRFADTVIQPKQSLVKMDDIMLLRQLPESLRMEVVLELNRKHLEHHPFFKELILYSGRVMQKVCRSALAEIALTQDDELFSPGQTAHHMYFLAQGKMQYTMDHLDDVEPEILACNETHGVRGRVKSVGSSLMEAAGTAGISERSQAEPPCKRWFCEAVLWTYWVHQGRMKALSETDIISLDAHEFQSVVTMHKSDAVFPRKYGAKFVEMLNEVADSGYYQDEAQEEQPEKVLSDLMDAAQMSFHKALQIKRTGSRQFCGHSDEEAAAPAKDVVSVDNESSFSL